MSDAIRLIATEQIEPNTENPRLIFRQNELRELQESIREQGVLVPITVFQRGARYVILDGERRWRCARSLGLPKLPAIVQPEPTRLQNIMMMFAIHNTRRDWDPLPTAYKLRELEEEFVKTQGYSPTERELARLASISAGEVRRLRNILALPEEFHQELMQQLELPREEQSLTVDHVLEASRGAKALRKRGVLNEVEEVQLQRALVEKFKSRTLTSTVEPRQLARIARAVERGELSMRRARAVSDKLIQDPSYSVRAAFEQSAARIDLEHSTEQLVERLTDRLERLLEDEEPLGEGLTHALRELSKILRNALRA